MIFRKNINKNSAIRIFLFASWALPLIIYGCISLLIPSDFYNNFSIVKKSVDFLREIILSINYALDIYAHANTTSFVGAARISSAFGFICAAWISVMTAIFTVVKYNELELSFKLDCKGNGITTKQLFGGVSWVPIFSLGMMFGFYCLKGDPSFGRGFTTSSRIGYTLISIVPIVFSGISVGFLFFNVTILFRRFFNKK